MLQRRTYAKNHPSDDFQTPDEAIEYIFKWILPATVICDPFPYHGEKSNIVDFFLKHGRKAFFSTGDAFETTEYMKADMIVTNPPYSMKTEALEHFYKLGKPFAMLLPLTALGEQKRIKLFKQYGVTVYIPPKRINYITPNFVKKSGAQFMSAWFTFNPYELPSNRNRHIFL